MTGSQHAEDVQKKSLAQIQMMMWKSHFIPGEKPPGRLKRWKSVTR